MDWDLLRYFMPVARLGSLTRAADQLKTTQSTVSRRVGELEAVLGTVLFARTPHGYDLTPEGLALLSKAQDIEDRMLDLERSHGGSADDGAPLGGTVRLATAENLATAILVPALDTLRSRHPQLGIELSTGVRSVSMVRREADLSLRLVRPTQNTFTVRKLGVQAHAVYASPAYLAQHRIERGPGHLANADLIGWDEEFASLQMAAWLREACAGKPLALATTSLAAQIAAVRSGIGVAVLPCFVGDAEPTLQRIVEPDEVFSQDLWLTFDPALGRVPRVRAVADWVAETVAAKAELLAGRSPQRTTAAGLA
jgi:DNA-binding transcriptional LysR family regulator